MRRKRMKRRGWEGEEERRIFEEVKGLGTLLGESVCVRENSTPLLRSTDYSSSVMDLSRCDWIEPLPSGERRSDQATRGGGDSVCEGGTKRVSILFDVKGLRRSLTRAEPSVYRATHLSLNAGDHWLASGRLHCDHYSRNGW